jgi:hypothetical protein
MVMFNAKCRYDQILVEVPPKLGILPLWRSSSPLGRGARRAPGGGVPQAPEGGG